MMMAITGMIVGTKPVGRLSEQGVRDMRDERIVSYLGSYGMPSKSELKGVWPKDK